MKTTPLLFFTLLFCSCIFAQDTASKSKTELNQTTEHKAVHANKLTKENTISYTKTSSPTKTNSIIEVSEKTGTKTKVTPTLSEVIDDAVPRTTIDLF